MANPQINNYINHRYNRWLDYAAYHCMLANLPDESGDVLNEVLYMLLKKEEASLDNLLKTKKGKYTELDFYVLKMIKLNITSETSPYRHKYKSVEIDRDVNWQSIEISDEIYEEKNDLPGIILKQTHLIREALDYLKLPEKEYNLFTFRFFHDEPYNNWPGKENTQQLRRTYNKITAIIKEHIHHNRSKTND